MRRGAFGACVALLAIWISGALQAEVVAGTWNGEFGDSLALAEANHVPLVLIWGTKGCTYCNQLWTAAQNSDVTAWMADHLAYFVHKQDNITSADRSTWLPDNRAAADWIDSFSGETGKTIHGKPGWSFPVLAVYWPQKNGMVRKAFVTGRSGSMPPVTSGTLVKQFLGFLDDQLGDFSLPQEVNFGVRTELIPAADGVTQAMPFVSDLDGDGLPDLLVGVKIKTGDGTWVGKVRAYPNEGTAAEPRYGSWTYLTVNGAELAEEQTQGGCQGLQAQFGDFNGDGYPDLVVGHLAGELEVYPGTETPGSYAEPIRLLGTASDGAYNRTYGCFYDANGDGCDELFVGFMNGAFTRFGYDSGSGAWTTNAVTDAEGNALRLPPQSQVNNRRSTPAFADVNGDGFADLLSGSTDGGIYCFPAVADGQWTTNVALLVEGEEAMERSRLAVGDLNGDGIVDLVAGYNAGFVAWNEGSYRVVFSCCPEPLYWPGAKIEPVRVSVTPAKLKPTVKVSGLPSGLSLTLVGGAYYITGTPTAAFDGTATFTITYVKGGVTRKMTEKVAFKVAELPALTLVRDASSTGDGSFSGGGRYLAGKVVTVSASPDTTSVFAGWYCEGEPFAGHSSDYRNPKISVSVPAAEETVLTARFATKAEDAAALSVACEPDSAGYAAGQPLAPVPVAVDSLSLPTLTAKGLPAGMKLNAAGLTLYGTPTKPGAYPVTLTAKNKSGAKASTNVMVVVRNFVDEEIPVADAYGPFVPGVPVELEIPEAVGCKATGLPSGLKFASATGRVTGTPKKPGASTVVFTKSVGRVNYARKASSTFVVGPYPVLSLFPAGTGGGTVKGAGAYAANRKVTVKATPDKTSAFAGWYQGDELLTKAASLTLPMPAEDIELTARFVTKQEDADSMAFAVAGHPLAAGETVAVTNVCGVAMDWPIEASALSAVTVKASGLPSGVKLVLDKATGACSLSGAPTASSSLVKGTSDRKPSTIRLTMITAGKATRVHTILMTVVPRPNWAVGSFDGAVACEAGLGTVTATVAANGKVSGKYLIGAKSYSFSAPSILAETDDGGFLADVAVKIATGVVLTDRIALAPRTYDALAPDLGAATADDGANFLMSSNAVQNAWTRSDAALFRLPAFAKNTAVAFEYNDLEFGFCSLAFKFGAKGAVTVAGTVGGRKVSASARILLDDIGPSPCLCFAESFNGRIPVAFKTIGFCRTFTFSGDSKVETIGPSDIVLELE